MDMEALLAGNEIKNVEFKEKLPNNTLKYMKTVIAFANGAGGKIIFGINDHTREIIGIPTDEVFKTADAITNAISDCCEPTIIPDISLVSVNGKTLIVVEIEAERQRPYYMRTLGKENGTYVRIAGTTRLADEAMLRELTFEGNNRHFDQTICLGLKVSEEDINNLCAELKKIALNNADHTQQNTIKDVTAQQLLSWGVLIEKDGELFPTNAYAILTGNEIFPMHIQCGLFKGNTKAVFIDKRDFYGPIWQQIEDAYQFVLRNIHLSAKINGIYRRDFYEIPPECIRELIINGAVHRSYLDRNNIQIAIYDDRLEVTSPGKLAMGQTIDRMKKGYSKIRNEALSHAFAYMNLIEHWGSGISRIYKAVYDAGLKEPEIIGGDIDLRINIYRKQAVENTEKILNNMRDCLINDSSDLNNDLDDRINDPNDRILLHDKELKLLQLLQRDPAQSQKKLGEQLKLSEATVKRMLNKMKKANIIKRDGSRRNGRWLIIKKS